MPFVAHEDGSFYYRRWTPSRPAILKVLLLHGRGEHSGLYHRFASALNQRGIEVWGLDHLGHGHTGGDPVSMCDIPGAARNIERLLAVAADRSPGLPTALVGHSLGGLTSAFYVSGHPEDFDRLVLCGTPLDRELGHMERNFPDGPPEMSRDEAYLDAVEVDPLIYRGPIPPEAIDRCYIDAITEIRRRADTMTLPILMVNGENDEIASADNAVRWSRTFPNARFQCIDGGFHDVLNDTCHQEAADVVCDFLLEAVSADDVSHAVSG